MAERRALIVTPDYPPRPGGIQILVHRLAAGLERLTPEVVAIDQPGAEGFDAGMGFPTVRVGSPRLPHKVNVGLLNARAAARGLESRPDVVLAAHIVAAPGARAVARALGVPYAVFVHADEVGAAPALARFAVGEADAVFGPSRHAVELAAGAGAARARCHVAHPGVDPAERRPAADRGEPPTIVTVARLEKRYKGHDVMARALPLVRARVPGVRWVVVGDGPLRPTIEALVAAHALDGSVTFTGTVPDAERDRWLARASVFSMPSRMPRRRGGGEGFGIVYVEAAAWRLPVVAGRAGGATDAVEDGATGLLVDPTDHLALADALTALLTDAGLRERLGEAGARRAETLTWARFAAAVERVLLDLAG